MIKKTNVLSLFILSLLFRLLWTLKVAYTNVVKKLWSSVSLKNSFAHLAPGLKLLGWVMLPHSLPINEHCIQLTECILNSYLICTGFKSGFFVCFFFFFSGKISANPGNVNRVHCVGNYRRAIQYVNNVGRVYTWKLSLSRTISFASWSYIETQISTSVSLVIASLSICSSFCMHFTIVFHVVDFIAHVWKCTCDPTCQYLCFR